MNLATWIAQGPVLTDGAWGTQLQALGLPVGACPDPWNLEHPDRVAQVPASYVAAGSRVVLTNTFRANRIALESHGVKASVAELNRSGVEISRQAAKDQARVFASIGPCGKMLMAGDVTEEELHEAFREQAEALAAAGADALVIETMSELEEALIALDEAKRTGLPVVVSMVYDAGADKDRTMMGVTPEQAAESLTRAGADVIGANCGQGIRGFVGLARRMRQATDRPLWIKANAGTPQLRDGQVIYPETPAQFASYVRPLLDAGVQFVGGCCGTSPAFIQALAQELAR